jgi:hypothetical protein
MTGRYALADRNTLTARYLDEVARQGASGRDFLDHMPTTGMLAGKYQKRFMTRPLFLGQAESQRLNADLQHIRTALVSLPGRLFGSDLAAFAQAVGMTGSQASAVARTSLGTDRVTNLARADLYPQPGGLRVLEYNMGSGIAGIDNAEICRAMLRYPLLREFARAHRLHCPDTMAELVSLIFAETGFSPDSFPSVAVVDWPSHYAVIGGFLHRIAQRWRRRGLDAHACHIGQLKTHDGRVWLRGRPVDIIFRLFLIEHLLEPDGPALMDPVVDAVARGEVAMFTPLDAELYGSKAPLAMLSDHANRHLFSPEQRDAFDRILPWTRMVRPGPVTLEDGGTVDLFDYAINNAQDLVLKPTLLHGGIGILPGWDPGTTAALWREQLTKAMGGPYVLQRRVEPAPEMCPGEDGELTGWIANWGVFTFPAGYGGVFARAFPAGGGVQVTRAGSGLVIGCCLVGGT